jgi:hypothetical protein
MIVVGGGVIGVFAPGCGGTEEATYADVACRGGSRRS